MIITVSDMGQSSAAANRPVAVSEGKIWLLDCGARAAGGVLRGQRAGDGIRCWRSNGGR